METCERVLAVLLPQAKIKYQPVTSANRIPLLQNGTIDLECGSTTTGTTLVQRLRRLEQPGFSMNVVMAKDHAEAFLLLEAGRVDAFAMDDNTLAGLIATSRKPDDFRIVGKPLGIEPIAIMIRKDDARFKNAFDEATRRLIASGEIERIYAGCFLQPIPPRNTGVRKRQKQT